MPKVMSSNPAWPKIKTTGEERKWEPTSINMLIPMTFPTGWEMGYA